MKEEEGYVKCHYHDELLVAIKQLVSRDEELSKCLNDLRTWRAISEELKKVSNDDVQNLQTDIVNIRGAISKLELTIAGFVTKEEFIDYNKEANNRIRRVHERIDVLQTTISSDLQDQLITFNTSVTQLGNDLREYIWKVLLLMIGLGGTAFAIIQWVMGIMTKSQKAAEALHSLIGVIL